MSETVAQNVFSTAKWIWAAGKQKKNDLCVFRRVIILTSKPKTLLMRVASGADYFLSINGKFVVWQGGISYEDKEGVNYYYDEIDVSKCFKKGENAIVIMACKAAKHTKAALIAELVGGDGAVIVCSDTEFLVYRNESNKEREDDFGADYFCYDATVERPLSGIYQPQFNSNIFEKPEIIAVGGDLPFGSIRPRPIPLYSFEQKPVFAKKQKKSKDSNTDIYKMTLPKAMYIFPILTASAQGTERIRIYTDRTSGNTTKSHSLAQIEYICKAQKQSFESFRAIYGQEVYFEAPKSVKIAKLGYRSTEYNSQRLASFDCSSDQLDALFQKCACTLDSCMREKLYNNVEKERIMSLDATNIAVRAILNAYDTSSHALIRKTLDDVINSIEDGVIFSNVPSAKKEEQSFAALLTISGQGMFAAYSNYFSDYDEAFLQASVDYLKKWENEGSLVLPRGGYIDSLYNTDVAVLENALYYSALNFAQTLANRTGNHNHDEYIAAKLEGFREAFEEKYFNGKAFASNPLCFDDRANAFCVLSGLCGEQHYAKLADMLVAVQNASPYLEGYVLEALVQMGRADYARIRMYSRYAELIDSNNSTMAEDFMHNYALTCSRSVMPLSVLLECFGGVRVTNGGKEITITPNMGDLSSLSFECVTPKGTISGEYIRIKEDNYEYIIFNDSKVEATVCLRAVGTSPAKTCKISKGKYKYTIG